MLLHICSSNIKRQYKSCILEKIDGFGKDLGRYIKETYVLRE